MKWILIFSMLTLNLWSQDLKPSKTHAIIDIQATKDGKTPLTKSTVVFKTDKNEEFTRVTDEKGQARISLPKGVPMVIYVKSITGYNEVGQINIPMNVPGGKWDVVFNDDEMEIANIFFDPGKYELVGNSTDALDLMAKGMLENPQYKFEIAGHTDNVGSTSSNMVLSKNRAQSVVDYLVSKGIDKSRLKAVGYGESSPKASNSTPEGREQNRRIEARPLK